MTHEELILQAELAATGANIHDVRSKLHSYLHVWKRLDSKVKAMAEAAEIAPLEKELRMRRRALELVLAGHRGGEAHRLARLEIYGGERS